jgi:hypothetical protein
LLHSEPKVCDFDGVVLEEDVGGFEVAVDDTSVLEVTVPSKDLVHVEHCLFL